MMWMMWGLGRLLYDEKIEINFLENLLRLEMGGKWTLLLLETDGLGKSGKIIQLFCHGLSFPPIVLKTHSASAWNIPLLIDVLRNYSHKTNLDRVCSECWQSRLKFTRVLCKSSREECLSSLQITRNLSFVVFLASKSFYLFDYFLPFPIRLISTTTLWRQQSLLNVL